MTLYNDLNNILQGLRCALIIGTLTFISLTTSAARALEVSLELILAVDCSSSVEPDEYALQVKGIADAFRHPTVIRAVNTAAPNGMVVTLV